MIESGSVADAGAFLARLVRLDPGALVRLRPAGAAGSGGAGSGAAALWARLPFDALVTRSVRVAVADDTTVRAADLLAALGGGPRPVRRDADWHWPLPPSPGRVVERLPAAELERVGAAAASTLREAVTSGVRGRAVGERMLRDALLSHVPIVVTADDGTRIEVAQRLVQAVMRMGFLGAGAAGPAGVGPAGVGGGEGGGGAAGPAGGPPASVEVRAAGAWIGLVAAYGSAWHRPGGGLAVRPGGLDMRPA